MLNIFCNGDSFTSGSDLMDHLFPNFPGFTTTNSPYAKDSDREWSHKRQSKGIEYFKTIKDFKKAELDAAWPNQLTKINPNINVVNIGTNGASMAGIANRTIVELLKHKDTKFDFVFIQLTSPLRVEFYKSIYLHRHFMNEVRLGWLDYLNIQKEKELATIYASYYKDEDFAIKYLYTLLNLRYAVKGLTGVYPILVSSLKFWYDIIVTSLAKNDLLVKDPIIQILINESGILGLTDDDFMETVQIKHNFRFTPCLHYESKCHEEFAKVIYNKYISGYVPS
jgi:hypothetical protein